MTKKNTNKEKKYLPVEASAVTKQEEYTEEEQTAIAKYVERSKKKPLPKFTDVKKRGKDSQVQLTLKDNILNAAQMFESLGTPDESVQLYLMTQTAGTFENVLSSDGGNEDKLEGALNNCLALLNGIQPQDEIEGMLACQMIAVHNLAMNALRRAMITDQSFEGRQSNVNHATKMLRTYTAQMEALKRYRTGGQQKVEVKHVHVNEGGQAIVGDVALGGRDG